MLKSNQQAEGGGVRLTTAPALALLPEPIAPRPVRLCLRRDQDFVALARDAKYHVNDFVALCGTAPREFQRQFQTWFHQSPREWLDDLQLADAAALLLAGVDPREVAITVGLSDFAYFCAKFQKRYGISPVKFLRNFGIHCAKQRASARLNGHCGSKPSKCGNYDKYASPCASTP